MALFAISLFAQDLTHEQSFFDPERVVLAMDQAS